MKNFWTLFSESAKEFKSLKSVVTAALLVALHTVFAFFLSVQVTDSLRISVSFLTNVVTGCLFGPVVGFVCGGVGDLIQFVIKPTGPYFIGWTINAALAGLIYGTFFYHKFPMKIEKKQPKQPGTSVQMEGKEKLLWGAGIALPLAELLLLFIVPFAAVVNKTDGALVVSGSAYDAVCAAFDGGAGHNIAMVAGILFVLGLFLLAANIWKLHVVPLVSDVFCCFASVLAVYTDKKITTPQWGFWLIVAVLVIYIAVKIQQLAWKHAVDLRFMVRCVLVLALDTFLVNIVLGTYWISAMYGKGFAFYFTSRLVKNLLQLPINIILTYYVLGFVKRIKGRMGL